MTISFPVRDAIAYPHRFKPNGTRIAFYGLLTITAESAILYDWQTTDRLHLDPGSRWRNWLPQEIPPLIGEYEYFDEATVCGWIRVEAGEVILLQIWSVIIKRDGNYLFSTDWVDR